MFRSELAASSAPRRRLLPLEEPMGEGAGRAEREREGKQKREKQGSSFFAEGMKRSLPSFCSSFLLVVRQDTTRKKKKEKEKKKPRI